MRDLVMLLASAGIAGGFLAWWALGLLMPPLTLLGVM